VKVDKSSLHHNDYARVKRAARDVSKVPKTAEGAILPYLHDFYYERELEMGSYEEGRSVVVPAEAKGQGPSPKKLKTGEQASAQAQLQMEVFIPQSKEKAKCLWIVL
jgi:hypothetical protein